MRAYLLRFDLEIANKLINAFSGRRLAAFATVEEAKAWLVRQTEPVAEVTPPLPPPG